MPLPTSAARRRRIGGTFAAGLVLAVGAAAASPAMAASTPSPLTTLTFTPSRGLDSTPMYVVVPQPCPAKATNIVALAVGHGFAAGGQPVVTNSTAGISHTAPFVVPLQDSFTGFAAVNGTKLSGSYAITLRCIDALGQFTYASFTGAVTFSDPTHYTAPAPPQSLADAVVAAERPATAGASPATTPGANASAAAGQPGGTSSAGSAASKPGAAASAKGSGGPAGSSGKASPTANRTSHRDSASSWQPWLVIGAVLLIAFGVLLRVREVRQDRRRTAMATRQPPTPRAKPDDPVDLTAASADPPTLTGSTAGNNHSKGHHS